MKGWVITYKTLDHKPDGPPLEVRVLCAIGGDGLIPIIHTRWMDARRALDTWLEMCPRYAVNNYELSEVIIK